jgi:hypothetical protein
VTPGSSAEDDETTTSDSHGAWRFSRRRFIQLSGGALLLAAGCGGDDSDQATRAGAPRTAFTEPANKLSGDLRS